MEDRNREELWSDGAFISLWSDGTIGISDGTGFVGSLNANRVQELFGKLQAFFSENERQQTYDDIKNDDKERERKLYRELKRVPKPKGERRHDTAQICPDCNGKLTWGTIPCPDGLRQCLVLHYGYMCESCGQYWTL